MTRPVDVVKESVVGTLFHGHRTVGTTAIQLTTTKPASPPHKGVLLRCPGAGDVVANTVEVWVGNSHVTADSTETTGGMPIAPGEALFIPIDDPTKLYVIASAASQDIAWMAV